ncbi:hypothetical protein BJ875DRAFT_475701 [Amylocarpus encephaloides]|uniref:Uncharacterized protein n=1 Tax=Amylocarpus encephaloides TaxID=45428 RepID=A0A9P7Y9X8_9HELO|nr:hypothetical protein BJ875DRAFT_475701 [Amylocarpus encephaloides]
MDSSKEAWTNHSTTSESRQLETLPSILIKFLLTAKKGSDNGKARSHSHNSLLSAFFAANLLQSIITPSTPPLKRNIDLRDMAQRLHLWPNDVLAQLQKDALQALALLDHFIREALKGELKYVENLTLIKTENRNINRQVGGIGEREIQLDDSLKELGVLRYQACLALEQLGNVVRTQVEVGDLEGPYGLEMKDLLDCLPELRDREAKKGEDDLAMVKEGLGELRINAVEVVEEHKRLVTAACDELLQLLNEDRTTDASQGAVDMLRKMHNSFLGMQSVVSKALGEDHSGGVD